MEWSDAVIALLRALWAEGHSTAEIGRRLGVTKNAIVGKAHRLDLPARPSPIRRDPEAVPVRRNPARRVEGPTLPPLPSAVADGEQGLGDQGLTESIEEPVLAPPAPLPPEPPVPPVIARPVIAPLPVLRPLIPMPRPLAPPPQRSVAMAPRSYGRVVTCCWPIGEPGTREFRFCDVPSEPGRPYCEDHVKVAYVKVRDRREDAA